MNIEVGKAYTTRTGKLAVVTIASEHGAVGGYIVYGPRDRRRRYWLASGRNTNVGRKLATDLVAENEYVPTDDDLNYFKPWLRKA
ncbi:hypothetical protein PQD73_gp011 [Stenotrophomonas phage Salva]|uniref:Uncharacterized protein n=1 Tax=Stenotrophomonas phage Salva TaxID=2801524 RepID=A0A7U3WJU2_9CAUD|nr:hypothetical protein PQD73_gp011 [Stenotrophomonas phage Salva]QQM18175.1 hypothetical protein CPT_Salva_011 [Stenotrophomonas phage Salva]